MTTTVQFQREVEAPLGCLPSEQSRSGDTVLVTYKGFLADGKVFDSNQVEHQSTNLREVSHCPETAPTRAFSLSKALSTTSTFTIN